MQTKAQKEKIVQELEEKLKKQKITIFTDFRGVSVAKSQTLRRQLRKDEAEFKVAKKTLIDRALDKFGTAFRAKKLEGEIGVVFGYNDQVAPAKVLAKFSKENETFKILGGILDGKVLSDKEMVKLAKLPAREALIGQLLAVLQSSLRGLVNVLGGNTRNLIVVLNKIKK